MTGSAGSRDRVPDRRHRWRMPHDSPGLPPIREDPHSPPNLPSPATEEEEKEEETAEAIPILLPTPRITTFNSQSLSLDAQGLRGRKRRKKKLKYIAKLLERCDILCVQETHLGGNPLSFNRLAGVFPGHSIYYNSYRLGHAGTLIMVANKYAHNYDITERILDRMDDDDTDDNEMDDDNSTDIDDIEAMDDVNDTGDMDDVNDTNEYKNRDDRDDTDDDRSDKESEEEESETLEVVEEDRTDPKGWLQVLDFRSKQHPDIPEASFRVANCYGRASGPLTERVNMITALEKERGTGHFFMVGDFNFVTDVDDSSGGRGSSICLGEELNHKWTDCLSRMGLREADQSSHTHFFLTKDGGGNRSSRIDRVYHSFSEADLCLVSVSAYLAYAGPSPEKLAEKYKNVRTSNARDAFRRLHTSDHLPVTFLPTRIAPSKTRDFNGPKWLGELTATAKRVEQYWVGYEPNVGDCPFQALADWKEAVRATVKEYFFEKKQLGEAHGDSVAKLTRAIALLRLCSANNQDLDQIRAYLRKHTELNELTELREDRFTTEGLNDWINTLFASELLSESSEDQGGEEEDPILPPSWMPGAKGDRTDPISNIKARMPAFRERLTGLRKTTEDEVTSDPEVMGEITSEHYTKIWKEEERPCSEGELESYLEAWEARVPEDLVPILPSTDIMIDVINGSNDSCAGPDGIPFAYYRSYVKRDSSLAQVLADIAALLGDGVRPPEGYNHARFFLIPKKTGGLIEDTRGISVTNGDNRLIARATADAMTPALQAIISPRQKGFVEGRVGADHIRELTHDFYSKLSKKQQHYVLLLDTKRAFDSLSHKFIKECLAKAGFPRWVSQMVEGLLHGVIVIPVLGSVGRFAIPIRKGVKQGCPLSPLLFILCFDVLLAQLECIKEAKRFGFADDLALALRSVTLILKALRIIHTFERISGLHLNLKKTHLVPARPPSKRTIRRLREAGWGAINISESAVYLGVRFGAETTTEEIFEEARKKFFKRAGKLHTTIYNSSLQDRILIVNTFLLPLFYYLAQFYIVPPSIVNPARALCHKKVVAFGGKAWAYAHAITPSRGGFGPATALKDLWAVNMSLLGSDFSLEKSEHRAEVNLGELQHVCHHDWEGSTLIHEHEAYAAFILLYSYVERIHGLISLTGLPPRTAATRRRRWVYVKLATEGYWQARRDPKKTTSLTGKICKMLKIEPDITKARQVLAHARLAARLVSPAKWNTQLRLTFHALPFNRRRRAYTPDLRMECYLCGREEDSDRHVYGDCEVVERARQIVSQRAALTLPQGLAGALLTYPPPSNPGSTVLNIVFNWAVWNLRSCFFASLLETQGVEAAARRIAGAALLEFNPDGKGIPLKEKALRELATNPPENTVVGFTDGSSLEDGEAGAGYSVKVPGLDREDYAEHLGRQNNNVAEMEALRRLLRRMCELALEEPLVKRTYLIFSDSACCLGFLLAGWKAPTSKALAWETRRLLKVLNGRVGVRLYWIRGHAGIPGNENVDGLAKQGAAGVNIGGRG